MGMQMGLKNMNNVSKKKTGNDLQALTSISKKLRKLTIQMAANSGFGHIASGLSMCDILAVLFFKIIKGNFLNSRDKNRDYFVLSKGHGAISLYATLYLKGLLGKRQLNSYLRDGSRLTAFPSPPYLPGIDFSSGSLGHGLSVGAGIAFSKKRDNLSSRVFVILSEGDCQEGSTWEAALFAGFHKLNNLIVIIDHNKLQAFGSVRDVLDLSPLGDKWRSFNFSVEEIDGHDIKELCEALSKSKRHKDKPTVIIAHTVKGKGVSFMENCLKWHYLPIKNKFVKTALTEIEQA